MYSLRKAQIILLKHWYYEVEFLFGMTYLSKNNKCNRGDKKGHLFYVTKSPTYLMFKVYLVLGPIHGIVISSPHIASILSNLREVK